MTDSGGTIVEAVDTPLSGLTTLRVGGPARRMLHPTTELELVRAAQEAWRDDEWLILGGGSNVLIGDDGVDGTVVRRTAWDTTALHPGAQVEVLTAVQGG